jgi:hypothetical protein
MVHTQGRLTREVDLWIGDGGDERSGDDAAEVNLVSML